MKSFVVYKLKESIEYLIKLKHQYSLNKTKPWKYINLYKFLLIEKSHY